MVKLAIFSDLHLHVFSEHSTLIDGVPSRLLDGIEVLRRVRSHCLEHGISCVAFCGDLLHKRGAVANLVLNLLVSELAAFQKAGIRFLAVDGNHDQVDRHGRVSYEEALRKTGLVEGVSADRGWKIWDHQGFTVSGFSYLDSVNRISQRLERNAKLVRGGRVLGLFHLGFKGARVGTHLEYVVREPISAKSLFAGHDYFSAIVSGHYHQRQKIRGIDDGIYVGSPLELARSSGDGVSEKGFLVYDADRNELEEVPLGLPRFVELDQEALDRGDFSACVGNFVDVKWREFPGGQAKLEEKLSEAGARAWKLIHLRERRVPDVERGAVDPSTPPAKALAAYLESKSDEVEQAGLDLKTLQRAGRDILTKATEDET